MSRPRVRCPSCGEKGLSIIARFFGGVFAPITCASCGARFRLRRPSASTRLTQFFFLCLAFLAPVALMAEFPWVNIGITLPAAVIVTLAAIVYRLPLVDYDRPYHLDAIEAIDTGERRGDPRRLFAVSLTILLIVLGLVAFNTFI